MVFRTFCHNGIFQISLTLAFIPQLSKAFFTHIVFLLFFDLEQRSKVLKEALLSLLFLAWNQVPKMFQIEQNCQGNKKCSREQKMCNETKNVLLWHIMVLNCCVYHLMWPRMVLLLFTAMAMCGLIRLSMDLCDLVWS